MTETDCGWPDPGPSEHYREELISTYGFERAQRIARAGVARYRNTRSPIGLIRGSDEAIQHYIKRHL